MTDEKCGSTDTINGEPCQRKAGWGLDSDKGPCKDHLNGRPTKFTEDRVEKILAAARAGAKKAGCARAAGIHRETLDNWLEEYDDFFDAWSTARWDAEEDSLEGVSDEWLLERSFGYAKKEELDAEVSGEIDGFNFVIDASSDSNGQD